MAVPKIAVRHLKVIKHRLSNASKIYHNNFLFIFFSVIIYVHNMIEVANKTELEFFSEKAYVSVIIKPLTFFITEYMPRNKDEKMNTFVIFVNDTEL